MNTRWKPSATVAAIIERQGKFLLVEEHTQDGLRLNNPAGHLDQGESPVQGCIRETLEETAFHFTPDALVGIYMSRFERAVPGQTHPLDITYLRFAFCGTLGAEVEGQALDEGIVRTVWMTPEEIRACAHLHRSPLLLTCMEDYLSGKRFPLELITTDPSVHAPLSQR
ncbi:NUDIX hydrolase [Polaromonas sp. A23]|uniref:NUDIX hydrolase n=1 Tax=Polaromonas sp. A23 TaxID=1944133 RepID=UPI0009879AAE|nr:NUDIX hydrolase [Polaromonas sp. A23]OOG46644.1 NUDIX hydrolase [Polaromonas sp. A23]